MPGDRCGGSGVHQGASGSKPRCFWGFTDSKIGPIVSLHRTSVCVEHLGSRGVGLVGAGVWASSVSIEKSGSYFESQHSTSTLGFLLIYNLSC